MVSYALSPEPPNGSPEMSSCTAAHRDRYWSLPFRVNKSIVCWGHFHGIHNNIVCVFFQVGELFVLSILNDYFLIPNNIICICIYYIYNLHLNGCVSPIYWWLVQSTVSAWIMIIHQWKSSVMSHVAIATPPNHTRVRRCLVTSLWFT